VRVCVGGRSLDSLLVSLLRIQHAIDLVESRLVDVGVAPELALADGNPLEKLLLILGVRREELNQAKSFFYEPAHYGCARFFDRRLLSSIQESIDVSEAMRRESRGF
jgi:hypothetical protein